MQNIRHYINKTIAMAALIVLATSSVQSAIIRVDNRPGRPTDFPDLGTAISKAKAGDTIYIAGSMDTYGSYKETVVNKKLKLIGPGYFLDENFPRNRTESFPATIYELRISEEGAGTEIAGLSFSRWFKVQANDCFIHRCHFLGFGVEIGNPHVVVGSRIHQCFFDDGLIMKRCRDLLVSNNLFASTTSQKIGDLTVNGGQAVTVSFYHNTFINCDVSKLFGDSQFTLESNILYFNSESGMKNFLDSDIRLSSQDLVGHLAVNGRSLGLEAPVLDEVFLRAGSSDARWQLGLNAENSARGAGQFGEDLGCFGGDTPYVISGIPPVPHFEIFEAQSTVGPTGTLKVRLKAKGGE